MKVSIPDDLFEHFGSDQSVAEALQRWQALDLDNDRVVLLRGRARERVEACLQGGYVASGAELADKVEALAALHIGEVRLNWTPGQWNELRLRAEKTGRTVQQVAEDTARGMHEAFFNCIK